MSGMSPNSGYCGNNRAANNPWSFAADSETEAFLQDILTVGLQSTSVKGANGGAAIPKFSSPGFNPSTGSSSEFSSSSSSSSSEFGSSGLASGLFADRFAAAATLENNSTSSLMDGLQLGVLCGNGGSQGNVTSPQQQQQQQGQQQQQKQSVPSATGAADKYGNAHHRVLVAN